VISRIGLSVLVVAVPDLQRNLLGEGRTLRLQIQIQMNAKDADGAIGLAPGRMQHIGLTSSLLE
jgi:hypothetical protein